MPLLTFTTGQPQGNANHLLLAPKLVSVRHRHPTTIHPLSATFDWYQADTHYILFSGFKPPAPHNLAPHSLNYDVDVTL